MLPSISLLHMICRNGATNGRKCLSSNSVKKLHCLAAVGDIKSTNNLVNRTQSIPMLDRPNSHLFKNTMPILLEVPCRKKGHSHWQNVRHIKAAADADKTKKITQFTNNMKVAITAGGPNPENNPKLKRLLETMKSSGVPKSDIKRYLENATNKATSASTLYYDIRGPRGCLFVLELESDSRVIARSNLNVLMKKTVGKIADLPTFQNCFDMKGMIEVPITKDMQTSNMDEYLEIAIEAGAEDVILTKSDENDEKSELVLKFHCDPKTLTTVAREIEETYDLDISSSRVMLYPQTWVTIDDEEELEACRKIADKLQQHPDFVAMFDNITVPEE